MLGMCIHFALPLLSCFSFFANCLFFVFILELPKPKNDKNMITSFLTAIGRKTGLTPGKLLSSTCASKYASSFTLVAVLND